MAEKNKVEFGPWDIVKLKGRIGRYRVYSSYGGHLCFACLDADILTVDTRDEVEKVISKAENN